MTHLSKHLLLGCAGYLIGLAFFVLDYSTAEWDILWLRLVGLGGVGVGIAIVWYAVLQLNRRR